MAYRKVCDTQAGPLVGEVLHCSGGLDLDWDLDKEDLQEPGPSMDRMQMQHVDCQISGRTGFRMGMSCKSCARINNCSGSFTIHMIQQYRKMGIAVCLTQSTICLLVCSTYRTIPACIKSKRILSS